MDKEKERSDKLAAIYIRWLKNQESHRRFREFVIKVIWGLLALGWIITGILFINQL